MLTRAFESSRVLGTSDREKGIFIPAFEVRLFLTETLRLIHPGTVPFLLTSLYILFTFGERRTLDECFVPS